MRLLRAELVKIRRRWASFIVLGLLIGLMALIYLLVGLAAGSGGSGSQSFLRFPAAYGILSQFVFGLGSLLALCYAAAIGGADWNWGVFRVSIARGESRGGYVLTKAIGLAIALAIGAIVAFGAGIVLTFLAAALARTSAGNPFALESLDDLLFSLGLGTTVLLERAAIGFAVAMLLRSQLAGVVVGIAVYFGETILRTILLVFSFTGGVTDGGFGEFGPSGTQWYQYLPFGIGDSVLAAAPGLPTDPSDFLLESVPLVPALIITLGYMALAVGISMLYAERTQIAS